MIELSVNLGSSKTLVPERTLDNECIGIGLCKLRTDRSAQIVDSCTLRYPGSLKQAKEGTFGVY